MLLFILPFLVIASISDLCTMRIPDFCSLAMLAAGFAVNRLQCLPCCILFLCAGCLLSYSGKIGMGDVKYIAAFSAISGIRTLYALNIACILCLAVQRNIKKESVHRRIPFAPYLSIGFFIVLLY